MLTSKITEHTKPSTLFVGLLALRDIELRYFGSKSSSGRHKIRPIKSHQITHNSGTCLYSKRTIHRSSASRWRLLKTALQEKHQFRQHVSLPTVSNRREYYETVTRQHAASVLSRPQNISSVRPKPVQHMSPAELPQAITSRGRVSLLKRLSKKLASMHSFLQFTIIGGGVFVLGMGLMYVLIEHIGMSAYFANGIQLAATFVLNYVLNRRLTWSGREISKFAPYKYLLSRGATTLLNQSLFVYLLGRQFQGSLFGIELSFSAGYITANILCLIVITVLNYISSDIWAFRHEHRSSEVRRRILASPRYKMWTRIRAFLLSSGLVAATVYGFLRDPSHTIALFLAITGVLLFLQSCFEIYRVLYTFRNPAAVDRLRFPTTKTFNERFCLIVPARHEAEVLAATLELLAQQTHSDYEIISVMCDDDVDTIAVARQCAQRFPQITVMEYPLAEGVKPSKPKQLNYVFERIKDKGFSAIGIIDAEDTVHPELLAHIDAAFAEPGIGIVQGGVQLMNHDSSWYALHNVLEYYRWFTSAMSFNAAHQFMPLGGNTIFIRTELLAQTNGWPDTLTEDCSLGVLLSARYKAKTAVYYEPRLATREETPDTLKGLFKQRVRWSQGFYHEWKKGIWRELPTFGQRQLANYTLMSPILFGAISILVVVSIFAALFLHAPVGLVMLMYLSLLPGILLIILNVVFLHDFGRAYERKIKLRHYFLVLVTALPYQMILNSAALWSVVREMRGDTSWHKTAHSGLHRQGTSEYDARQRDTLRVPALPAMSEAPHG